MQDSVTGFPRRLWPARAGFGVPHWWSALKSRRRSEFGSDHGRENLAFSFGSIGTQHPHLMQNHHAPEGPAGDQADVAAGAFEADEHALALSRARVFGQRRWRGCSPGIITIPCPRCF